METNNYFKKAPSSDGFKMQIGCRVPQNVHDRLRNLAHQEKFTSFSAFLETVLTNYDNQQKTLQELDTRLATAGAVFEKGLAGLKSEAKDVTELRFFFFNVLMEVLEVDQANRNNINSELTGDRDRENMIQIMGEAVPEFRQLEWEDSETVKSIEFLELEIKHINTIVDARIKIGVSENWNHFLRQCVDFSINYNKQFKEKKFGVPPNTPLFYLKNGLYEPTTQI